MLASCKKKERPVDNDRYVRNAPISPKVSQSPSLNFVGKGLRFFENIAFSQHSLQNTRWHFDDDTV
jgi:hypothetical protein